MSVSDVVELFETEEQNSDSKCFYVDSVGYKELDNFDTSLCEDMDGEKAVYITPHHTKKWTLHYISLDLFSV